NWTHNVGTYAYLALGATQADLINNGWSTANLQPQYKFPIYSTDGNYAGSNPGTPSFYVSGNISYSDTTPTSDQATLCRIAKGENILSDLGPFQKAWFRSTPLANPGGFAIPLIDAVNLRATLAPLIGNSQHLDLNGNWTNHRDQADQTRVNQVLSK